MTKIVSLVKTRPGTSPEAFREYWRGPFLNSILDLEGLTKSVVKITHNHVLPLVIRDDFPISPWAGFSEMWFDERGDADGFLNHPALPGVLASHSLLVAEVLHLHCTELPTWDVGVDSPPLKMMAFFLPSRNMT